ncbi:MAG: response regulator [bacterium]
MTKKILIVEDDPLLFQLYQEMFKRENVTTINATNGHDAVSQIKTDKPDLIILDIMLPGGMNGFDILEKIEADPATQPIPVIILTNLDSEKNVANQIGAKKYLVKVNTTKEELLNTVMPYLR